MRRTADLVFYVMQTTRNTFFWQLEEPPTVICDSVGEYPTVEAAEADIRKVQQAAAPARIQHMLLPLVPRNLPH
jgi:hypothetical protein